MRSRTAFLPLVLVSSLAVAVVVACGGSDGANGANGTPGTAGAAGQAGAAGATGATGAAGAAGANGGGGGGDAGQLILTLSERAQQGLRIVPPGVTLNLANRTADELELIGIGSYMANGFVACADCHSPDQNPAHYFSG